MSQVNRLRWVLISAGAILLVLGCLWSVGLARVGLSLREHLAQAQALMGEAQAADPVTACELVQDLRDDVARLDRYAGGLVWLAPALGWLPGVGGDLRAAPHLLDVADGLTEAGALLCDALGPALSAFAGVDADSPDPSLDEIAHLLSEEKAVLEQALAATERAQAAWAQVDSDGLSPWLAGKIELLDRALPLLRTGLEAAVVAPEFLGMNGSRTYLILAQNEDELRPSGGFISGAGEMRVEEGRLAAMVFRDSYAVDDFSQPYPDAPEPLRRYMGFDLWVFRDSNWSPDFPTSARQAISLYRPGYSVTIDGVIAVDQHAVQQLVGVLGSLEVEGADGPVTEQTVIPYMRQAWAPEDEAVDEEWWAQRKAFMGNLAWSAWNRVNEGQVNWAALSRVLLQLLEEKHVLIYLENLDAAAVLAEQGWDGALRSGPGDYLMVVDANIGYNKANAQVQEEIAYQIDLRSSPLQATLALVHANTGTVGVPCIPEARYDPVYEQMINRCYWDYLRVYVPEESSLLEATEIPVSGAALLSSAADAGDITVQPAEEGPWLTFGVLGLVPPTVSQTRTFVWTLPAEVVSWEDDEGWYSLRVQKQPGTRGHPLIVRIRLPEGGTLLDAVPEPSSVEGDWVTYQLTLDGDREFELRFER
jgi:hypothetical protein